MGISSVLSRKASDKTATHNEAFSAGVWNLPCPNLAAGDELRETRERERTRRRDVPAKCQPHFSSMRYALEADLLEVAARGGHEERLAQREDALLDADAGALDQNEVVLHNAVAREAAERGDRLLGAVGVGLAVVRVRAAADPVDPVRSAAAARTTTHFLFISVRCRGQSKLEAGRWRTWWSARSAEPEQRATHIRPDQRARPRT